MVSNDPIAIIGMAGRFPQSEDLEALWQHLLAGDDLITEVPPERWDWRSDATGRARWGGFVPGIDRFDARLFGFTPKEAELMDPQQRLFLQAAWAALESAGLRPSDMAGSDTGVFVGVAGTDYHELLGQSGVPMDAHRATGVSHSLVANRVSYVLGLHGPSEAIDTACSSSLVALHRAVLALRAGECTAALVGGVNALLRPEVNIAFGKAGMLSPDGRCRSFGKDANGYVRGEGVGAVVLKPLAAAESDGDPILGVIRGSAVNHGGKANSLTAPNPNAQARAMARAWAGVDPATVSYIEAHGTGTALGDPVEINGLKTALAELGGAGRTWTPQSCGIGSIKSNIGHLETAAGIAGLIKVLLALRAKRLPASLHLAAPNPLIELSGTPFYLVRESRDWQAPVDADGHTLPRRAGVNSFGFGGANAHALIEEYPEPARLPAESGPQLIVLAARSEAGLIRTARKLAAWLERADPAPRLADVAHTLRVGREAWNYRVACVVSDLAELRGWLAKLAAGEEAAGIWRGKVGRGNAGQVLGKDEASRDDLAGLWRDGQLERLAELWVSGAALDWSVLEPASGVRRIHLPPSPLEEERYWAPMGPAQVSASTPGAAAALHPLLDDNVSSLDRLEFRKRFTPSEFVLAEHRVAGRSLLPAAAYLEICRAAAELAAPGQAVRAIEAACWSRPFSVADAGAELRIGLYPEAGGLACEIVRDDTVLAVATVRLAEPGQGGGDVTLERDAIRARCPRAWNPEEIYGLFRAHGFEYGPGFQVLAELWSGPGEALARLALPAAYRGVAGRYGLHPALLDGALQSVAVLMREQASDAARAFLPYALERLELLQPVLPPELYVHAVRAGTDGRFDLLLADEAGRGVARLVGFTLRELGTAGGTVERPAVAAASVTAAPDTALADHASLTRKVRERARAMVAELLRVTVEDIDPDGEIAEYGLDSLAVNDFAAQIEKAYGISLNPTLFYEHPTITSLVTHLVETHPAAFAKIHGAPAPSAVPAVQAAPPTIPTLPEPIRVRRPARTRYAATPQAEPIAVIGMAGRFPQSADLEAFWEHLLAGDDLITEVPADRWDWRAIYGDPAEGGNRTLSKWGGFMPNVDKFDPLCFGISPREAELMDPQQRLILQTTWGALENAGLRPAALAGSDTGVFVGVGTHDYQDLMAVCTREIQPHGATGTAQSLVANRVSYVLGLHGPSEAIDTACSSSLVALHRAVLALRSGECGLAVVGGVNALLRPELTIAFGKAGMLSPDGRCRSFGKEANGYVRGEGVGVVVLKPLAAAESDGDPILGVIRGSAVNHGGKANSLTAPNPNAQARAIVRAWSSAGVDPATVGYIEAHGTGTAMGDPVEINGLKKAFAELGGPGRAWTPGSCGIGSVKSNIGHLETAAGVAGLIKVLLSLRARRLPASLHLAAPNPLVELDDTPFYLVRDSRDWPAPADSHGRSQPRRAGVSSFGFGGANAHVLVEEYPDPARLLAESGPQLIVLAARSEDGLTRTAANLAAWLDRAEPAPRLAELAYTLQAGREASDHRAACVVADLAELRGKLTELAAGKSADFRRGVVERSGDRLDLAGDEEGRAYLASLWRGGKLERLAELWVRGVAVNWQILARPAGLRRIALPPSPMEEARYWIVADADSAALTEARRVRVEDRTAPVPQSTPVIPPESATAAPSTVRHRLSADHPLLRDHRVRGQAILPGAGFLELAWTALTEGRNQQAGQFEDVYWRQPVVGDASGRELVLELAEQGTATEISLVALPERNLCASARWQASPAAAPAVLAIGAIQQRLSRPLAPERLYALFREAGLDYGPHFQVIGELWAGEGEALARLDLPPTVPAGKSAPSLPVSLLDGAMQTVIGALQADADAPDALYLPVSLAALSVYGPLPRQVFAHAIARAGGKGEFLDFDIIISAPDGRPLAKLRELSLRRVAVGAHSPLPVEEGVREGRGQPLDLHTLTQALSQRERGPAESQAPAIGLVELAPVWQAAPLGKANPSARVLLLDDDAARAAALGRLAGDTSTLIRVNSGTGFAEPEPGRFVINPTDPDDYSRLFEALRKRSLSPDAVLHGWPDSDPTDGPAAAESLLPLFLLARALIRARLPGRVRLLSTYAAPTPAARIIPAALAGLLRTLAQEQPAYAAALVEQVAASAETQAQTAWAELAALAFGAAEIRHLGGERLVRGWQTVQADPTAPVPLREQGVYLITGGAGGLGLIFARHLANHYRARLVLTGRERLAGPRRQAVDALREAGAEVVYIRADTAKPATMRRVVRVALLKFGGLHGVIHAAGLLRDGPLAGKEPATVRDILRPKLAGTLVLEQALREAGAAPDFLALFSSLAGAFGNPGQGDYATANRFLDAYAENHAGQAGTRVLSINWPWWLEGGMALPERSRERMRELVGLDPLDTATGLAAFESALAGSGWQRVVGQGDMARILASFGGKPAPATHQGRSGFSPTPAPNDGRSDFSPTPAPSDHAGERGIIATSPVASASDRAEARPTAEPTTRPVVPADTEQLRAAARDFLVGQLAAELKLPVEKIQPDAPLEKYGIDSFLVLKLTRTLEATFGNLPKTLFFEYFTLAALADYFAAEHAERLREVTGLVASQPAPDNACRSGFSPAQDHAGPAGRTEVRPTMPPATDDTGPWLLSEAELAQRPDLAQAVAELLTRHGGEAAFAVNRAVLAPQLFIAADRSGFLYLNRSADALFVWTYVGPAAGYGALIEALRAAVPGLPLDILTVEEEASVLRGLGFTTTPFGTHQANAALDGFTLNGGPMHRLRYQVSRYAKVGQCRTEGYRPGQNAAIDAALLQLTADWVALKGQEPPFLAVFRSAVLGGRLGEQHRLFLTWRGEALDSAIVITHVPPVNGYLMDLEFYRGDLPLGGLEFAICRIIETLRDEGCRYFSLGATLGTGLEPCGHEDPAVLATLRQLHGAGMFNGDKNLQFKNKFRFEARTLFLCRPRGSDPASILNLMLLLSNPTGQRAAETEPATATPSSVTASPARAEPPADGEQARRQAALTAAGWNVLRLTAADVPHDLKTDSWSELDTAYVRARLAALARPAAPPPALEEALRGWFPFPHILPVAQGRQAEAALCRALGKPGGKVLQNPLFPTWIYHQIDRGLRPEEIAVGALSLDSPAASVFRADLDLARLERALTEGAALVVVELANNALGGYPVSLANLQAAHALTRRHGVPLFLDATRALENAAFIRAHEPGWADKSLSDILHALCAHADGLTASLGKDFGCNTGGLLACHDMDLYQRCREFVQSGGSGLPVVSRSLLAAACADVAGAEAGVLARMAQVRALAETLARAGLPVLNPPGGHGVSLDIARLPAVRGLKQPIPAFLAALYVATGIRAGAHSTGLSKPCDGALWVRLAVPVGLDEAAAQDIGARLVAFLKGLERLPDLALATRGADPLGDFTAEFIPVEPVGAGFSPRRGESLDSGRGLKATPTREIPARPIDHNEEPIAIIGAAGRYPGADDLEAFWDVLRDGRDCISEVPPERWDYRQHKNRDGKVHTRWAGFIADHDKFDPRFFNILPLEAENLDPQERLFLETAWATLEDAGYTRDRLRADPEARRMGVFTGVVWSLYALFGAEETLKGNVLVPSSFHWSIPNRVSYFFDLEGPSLAVDTACSASLTALHLACESLRRGECATALVGGVNLELHPNKGLLMDQSGMTSSEGKCRSFGADGDGYVPGEGVGAVLLKPLSAALRDGDRIDGLIRATATNHGGKTNGYTVPNPNAQARLIAATLRKAGVDPRSLGYVEAHGTGTALGDPIEVAGLTKAFREWTADTGFCALGSVKSNIGHLEAAAGIAGLTKLLLQFRHRRLVPSLHAGTLNPHIEFAKTPFHVQRELSDWPRPVIDGVAQPRRAALSSFGAGGANVHVVLEEFESPESAAVSPVGPVVLILSARDETRVRDYAGKLLASLKRWTAVEQQPSLSAIAYTLQVRREAFAARLALVANSLDEAIAKLAGFLAGDSAGVHTGKARDGVAAPAADAAPEVLAQAFVAGAAIDWASHYGTTPPRPVALPTYPFARNRLWLSISDNAIAPPAPAPVPAGLHPLLDRNVSGFGGIAFEK
ncbi:SDR family NAD(P)-dependent oxidoreductase, partial [Methylomagnum sp.]